MPLFLIPLAISLFSAGVGIYSQIQENNRLTEEAAKTLAQQQAQNKTDIINQYTEYIRTVDTLNDEQKVLDQQNAQRQQSTQHTITLALYTTAGLLLMLTLLALTKYKAA